MNTVSLGFLPEPHTLPLSAIELSHPQPAALTETRKFRQIVASIKAVGLIEPLSVNGEGQEDWQVPAARWSHAHGCADAVGL
jgi:hypothetical protein